ncbi:MAG: hypothetical protein AVO35_09835 [Candidatus Aegiribacteria sp. MLS_C]|nr:MAG: hypothetical protein AVO35_09835 [Candidatus Aegiribacteria sp. MLS_C]
MLMSILAAVLLAGTPPVYRLTIEDQYLAEMLADPYSDVWYPAHIECPGGESDCLVKIRGNTSPEFPKKSLAINLDDPGVLGRTRLNLNAQYRDLSQMRDGLGMLLTRLMGFPSPLTSHALLYVNNEYWGVYLEIERVDGDFLSRNGYGPGPLFKATDHTARFGWLPSGVSQTFGYRPMSDSEVYLPDLLRLIDAVLLGEGFPDIDTEMFLAYYAVVLGIVDNDGGSMNFYLHRDDDGSWRVFPWDRDSSFGSEWGGFYNPELYRCTSLLHLQRTALYCRLLQDTDMRVLFDQYLMQISDLMEEELLASVDSIYEEIRGFVYTDTMKQGSNADFDQAYLDLREFLLQRSSFIQDSMMGLYRPVPVCSISIDPVNPSCDHTLIGITAWTEEPVAECWPFITVDRGETFGFYLEEVPGSGGTQWSGFFLMPVKTYAAYYSFRTLSLQAEERGCPVYFHFFPEYGYMIYQHDYWLSTHPASVVRLAPFRPDELVVGVPVRYGPDLWLLPLVNGSTGPMDLSLCSVELGEPPGRVFFPESTVVQPGNTLFIASDLEAAESQWSGRSFMGSSGVQDPGGTALKLLDPAWKQVMEEQVPQSASGILQGFPLVISEINHSGGGAFECGDWLELYNPSEEAVDVGGYLLEDGDGNVSMVPYGGGEIGPRGFLVLCNDIDRFRRSFPDVSNVLEGLGFGLSGDREEIRIYDRGGNPSESMYYMTSTPWPDSRDRILSLLSPLGDWHRSDSWEAVDRPGTPGSANPGWFHYGDWLQLGAVDPNPCRGSIMFDYSAENAPVRGMIFDLAGRLVLDLGILPPEGGSMIAELPEREFPPGTYFLMLRAGGRTACRKFVAL